MISGLDLGTPIYYSFMVIYIYIEYIFLWWDICSVAEGATSSSVLRNYSWQCLGKYEVPGIVPG